MMKLSDTVLATLALTVALTAGCEHGDDHGDEDPAAEACTHLKGTPIAVQAGATSAEAPLLPETHTRYVVALPPQSPSGRGGVVSFGASGDLRIYLGADVDLRVYSAALGTPIVGTRTTSGAPCPELAVWYQYGVAGRINLTLGGASNDREAVDLVLEARHHD